MNQPIEADRIDDLLIYRLSGELSTFLLDRLKREIAVKAKNEKMFQVLLNLGDVEYITSKDLGVFVQIYRFLDDESRKSGLDKRAVLALSDLRPFVRNIIEMTRLQQVFRVFETESEAVSALATGTDNSSPETT